MKTFVSENNEFIYRLLESKHQLPVDFTVDKVFAFDDQNDFYIVVYTAAGRNFILFSVKDCSQDIHALPDLINYLLDYPDIKLHPSFIEKAVKLAENRLYSKNNSRFYFDAH